MSAAPETFLNRDLLRHLAGEQSFASGEREFASGRVQRLCAAGERVSAQVAGSSTHRVRLWQRQGQLCYECDCEAGQASAFCQHCVAVGLAWLTKAERHSSNRKPTGGAKTVRAKENQVREQERQRLAIHLETLDPARLAALVLEATDYDEILRRRLLMETLGVVDPKRAHARAGRRVVPDFGAYQELLRQAVSPAAHVDYHSLPDFVQGIEEAIAPLGELLRAGWYAEVMALTEYVLVELDAASDRVDIGDGLFNRIYDELQRVHLAACRAGAPVADLAARLLHYELEGGLGIFNNAAKTYATVLGTEGLAVWRSLLVREWRATREGATPLLAPRRFHAQMLMERLAKETQDFDALLALKEADLRGIHDRVGLAEWLFSLGRTVAAIRYAERLSNEYPSEPEKSVWRGFLLSAYQKTGRMDDALRQAWAQFCDAPTTEHYRELKGLVHVAEQAQWPEWREKAFAMVRRQTGQDRSRLVELLIEDQSFEEAWGEIALGVCRDDFLLLLAERREAEHPADALLVYQRHLESLLAHGPRMGYAEPVALAERIRGLFHRLHREKDFAAWLAALRTKHRQKRGFLRLLATAGF